MHFTNIHGTNSLTIAAATAVDSLLGKAPGRETVANLNQGKHGTNEAKEPILKKASHKSKGREGYSHQRDNQGEPITIFQADSSKVSCEEGHNHPGRANFAKEYI